MQRSNGGGFILAGEEFGRMFDNSFPACAFLFKWRVARAHSFHSLGQNQLCGVPELLDYRRPE